jgi:predicted lipoprotein with Yx(FWY)xxD motif
MPGRSVIGTLLLAVGLVLAAGCSSGSKNVTAGAGTSNPSTATVSTRSTKLGAVLTDAGGRTLYTYDKDPAAATASACTGTCATVWPPLMTSGAPTAGAGVTGTLSTIPGASGGSQVTWNGHPLYLFASDTAPGDTSGDGVGGFSAARVTGSGSTATTAARPGSRY